MNKYKYSAGIILFNPSKDNIDNIKSYDKSFDLIYIWDNSNDGKDRKYDFNEKYIVLSDGDNKGLPYAYNKILGDKRIDEFDFLCTLDQDSIFKKEDIDEIKDYIESIDACDIGAVGPKVVGLNQSCEKQNISKEKPWLISSGSFINLKILRKENIRYDEYYFIDRFDVDFFKQLTVKKYKVLMYYGSVLHHQLGDGKHNTHNVLRHYYIFRNRFYFNNKWYQGLNKYLRDISQTILHILRIILYEGNRIKKIEMLNKGFKDYKNDKR